MSEASRREFIQGGVSAIVGLVALKSGLSLLPAEAAEIAEPRYSKEELLALRERLRSLMWAFDTKPYETGQHVEIFRTYKSTLAIERRVQMRYLGLDESRVRFMDNDNKEAKQSYIYNFEHAQAMLGFAATPDATDEQLVATIRVLCQSFQHHREVLAASVLNGGLIYDPTVGGDGICLLSTQHPHDDGAWANTFPEYRPLTPDSLREAAQIIGNFVDERNIKIIARPRKLVVPVMQALVLEHMIEDGTFPSGLFPEGWAINVYLQDPDSWYILTNIDGLNHFKRIPLEMDAWLDHWDFDPTTDKPIEHPPQHVLGKGYERYSFGCADPRAIFGVMKKGIPHPRLPDPVYSGWPAVVAAGATGQVFREGTA